MADLRAEDANLYVYGLDGAQAQLPGILERIVSKRRVRFDAVMAGRVRTVLEQAGIRPSGRRI